MTVLGPSSVPEPLSQLAVEMQADASRWLAPAAAACAVVLGGALEIANGRIYPAALWMVALTLAMAIAAAVIPRSRRRALADVVTVRMIVGFGLIAQAVQFFLVPPVLDLTIDSGPLMLFQVSIIAIAIIGLSMLWSPPWVKPLQIVAIVALHFAIGAWIIQHDPRPPIDVNVYHHDAIAALRAGINPYTITFRNLYDDTRSVEYYGPGLAVNGRLLFGFPYPPLSLLVTMPAELLAGDFRYASLMALELAAVLMAFARPKGFGGFAAALYLTSPRIFFVLDESWTEPLVVLGLAFVVFAACRSRRAAPWLLGGLLALKQYLVFVVPAAWLLVAHWNRTSATRLFAPAFLVAGVVTLPFFLWNPHAFWHSVVALQFYQPLRLDALSFVSWWVTDGHAPPSIAVAFGAMFAASALGAWRLPRTPAGFAAAVALTYITFFAFNKQAFCNYYFFVVGSFCLTLAAVTPYVMLDDRLGSGA